MDNKILSLLGFASKAGKLGFGMSKTNECLKKGITQLIVCANDLSEKSKKEILYFAHNKNVTVSILKDVCIEKLSMSVGKKCGVVSVNDKGFAEAISNILGGLSNDQ